MFSENVEPLRYRLLDAQQKYFQDFCVLRQEAVLDIMVQVSDMVGQSGIECL